MQLNSHLTAVTFIMLLAATCYQSVKAEDIPLSYYDSIEGKSDSLLKSTLSRICRGGVRYAYGTTTYHSSNNPPLWVKGDLKEYGTWQAFPLTDIRDDGSVWDMYSDSRRYYPNKRGDSGCSLNIEHCLPKSWWGGTVNDAYKDLYHLNPSDQAANQQKSNYAPGHVKKGDKFDNGSFRMDNAASSGYGYICFEPAAEYRGDFARAYFYIATAYEDINWDNKYAQYISKTSYLMFSDSVKKVLLDWHRSDPVSEKEICRANSISDIQHNRNPFIDYPELVEYIWGNMRGNTVSLASLSCTAGTAVCHDYIAPVDSLHLYDTIINLPALTSALVNAVPGGSALNRIQSNGSASITMGTSSDDGELRFTSLALSDSALLVFRASPYNSATSMQLDVYADDCLLQSIQETVVKNTRNEVRYTISIPAGTNTLRLVSIGGSTAKRACMQELYLLTARKNTETAIDDVNSLQSEISSQKSKNDARTQTPQAVKYLQNGSLFIRHTTGTYDAFGRRIR